MNKVEHIGIEYPIHDAKDKVEGKVKYICDMASNKTLHCYLLTSSVAYANIIGIDTDQAYIDGVIKIYTPYNTPQLKFNSYRWIDGLSCLEDEKLLNDKVLYNGDRVCLVVAKSYEIAKEASKLIKIDYSILPHVSCIDEAKKQSTIIKGSSNLIYEGSLKTNNYCINNDINEDDVLITNKCSTQRISHAAMETHVAFASFSEVSNILTIYSPSQISNAVAQLSAEITGLKIADVCAIKSKMGGSFGGKTHPIPELLVAYAAFDLKAEVSLVFDRTTTFLSARTRTATQGEAKAIFSKDGLIKSFDLDIEFDSGAYATNIETVCIAGGKKTFRLYNIANQSYNYKAYFTNMPISGAARGYGSPQVFTYLETNVNMAAKKLNIDPVILRLKNLYDPFDNDKINGPNLGNIRIKDALIKGSELFRWNERKIEIDHLNEKNSRFKRGIGVAVASHGNGYYPAYPDFITIEMFFDIDGCIQVKASLHDQGCGTIQSMKQIIAQSLNVGLDQVIMCEANTNLTPYDSAGTQACRVTHNIGKAMQKASIKLKSKVIKKVTEYYNAKSVSIYLENVYIDNDIISLKEMVKTLRFNCNFDLSIYYTYKASKNPASTAVNFVEVEVDVITGNVRVIETVQVHDIGQVINKELCDTQISGGIAMGIGLSLSENYLFDKNGICKSASFSRYSLTNTHSMPKVITGYINGFENSGPFGAKSIGEISTIPITPAIISAIAYATNHWFLDLPITPNKISSILHNLEVE